jgi:hypothetical protein
MSEELHFPQNKHRQNCISVIVQSVSPKKTKVHPDDSATALSQNEKQRKRWTHCIEEAYANFVIPSNYALLQIFLHSI